jgi:alkylation response protein AidB-like acyl-CoA dehydrogenase
VDFEPSDTQRALLDALDALLRRHAGPARSRDLAVRGEYDHVLEAKLRAGGFLDLFADPDAGPLEAALAVERIGAELGAVSAVPHLLVLPALGLPAEEGPVVLAFRGDPVPVRYGAAARRAVVAGGDRCAVAALLPEDATPVPSAYGYPLARVVPQDAADLDAGTAERMTAWWRVGVSAEAVGMMRKALEVTVRYAKDRTVFGRSVGSFQALQHRMAELSVHVEGARWLTYEAAFQGAPAEGAAVAAAHTMSAVRLLTRETHQIMGAVGLTREHDLHLWTLRLQQLAAEAGGLRGHRRAAAGVRWEAAA